MASENVSDRERRDHIFQSRLEFWKTAVDFYKHLMTVALASIAAFGGLLGTVFKKAAAQPSQQPLIYLILGCFILVLLLSFVGLRLYGDRILRLREVPIESAEVMQNHLDNLPRKRMLTNLGFYEKALFVKPTWRPGCGLAQQLGPFALCFYPHSR